MTMQERLADVQNTIRRDKAADDVRLVAVTKYASLQQMRQLYELGVRDFGENKVQDALEKMAVLPPQLVQDVTWHLIGHLQSNKVNKAVGVFDWIHSVDSAALAEKIARRAEALGIRQNILLQVNLTGEKSKEGFTEAALKAQFNAIIAHPNLSVRGLMTIAMADSPEEALKVVFDHLRVLRDTLRQAVEGRYTIENFSPEDFEELSMGMSHDYGHALKSGATIIRIGQYLLS